MNGDELSISQVLVAASASIEGDGGGTADVPRVSPIYSLCTTLSNDYRWGGDAISISMALSSPPTQALSTQHAFHAFDSHYFRRRDLPEAAEQGLITEVLPEAERARFSIPEGHRRCEAKGRGLRLVKVLV